MSKILKLFGEFERNDFSVQHASEACFDFLNRAAQPKYGYIREVLQKWFDKYNPKAVKREGWWKNFQAVGETTIRARDTKHLAAFFELYMHHLSNQLGFDVVIEPAWNNGTKPDFRLTASTGQQILLEATVRETVNNARAISSDVFYLPDHSDKIRTTINKKSGHYGEVSMPYIVAVNVLDDFRDDEDVLKDLYGTPFTDLLDSGEIVSSRYPDGLWFGDGESNNIYSAKDFSGLLDFRALRPENMHLVKPFLWHNPDTRYSIDSTLWKMKHPDGKKGRSELVDDISISEVLGLDVERMW